MVESVMELSQSCRESRINPEIIIQDEDDESESESNSGDEFTENGDRWHLSTRDHDTDYVHSNKNISQGNFGKTRRKADGLTDSDMFKTKLKLLMLGPCMCGKTALANFLAEATDNVGDGGNYSPTQGVRILEFEAAGLKVGGRTVNAEVELWDCSGNQKFEQCWPALMRDVHGVILVYNPDESSHDRELEMWHRNFIVSQGLKETQCTIFAHHKPKASEKIRSHITGQLAKIPLAHTSLDEEADSVREEFNHFLTTLLNKIQDKREQEELSIMNQRQY